jgi:hypothetical protein
MQSGKIITGLTDIRTELLGFLALKPRLTAEITALASGAENVALTRSTWNLVGTDANGRSVCALPFVLRSHITLDMHPRGRT